jgi:hypothetical protein
MESVLHLAPDPHALARSGCWITDKQYVSFLPPFVARTIILSIFSGSGRRDGRVAVVDAISNLPTKIIQLNQFNSPIPSLRSILRLGLSLKYQSWFSWTIPQRKTMFPTPKLVEFVSGSESLNSLTCCWSEVDEPA